MRTRIRSSTAAAAWTLTVALAATALAGCLGGAQTNSSLFVKDGLTDQASAVHVTFTKAQVKAQDGAWSTVFEGKETIELLSLSAADARERLAAFSLAPGEYEGLRIAVSEVEVTYLDGTTQLLNVFGNVVMVADDFTVGPDGIDILVDFDLDEGVDLLAGTYTPVVGGVQTSDDDHDGDGVDDVDDADDDNDGLRDDEDEDVDGDGEDDAPHQVHAASEAEACEQDRQEELAEALEDRNESIEDAQEDLDEIMGDAEKSDEERATAWARYNASVAQAQAEHDEEVAEEQADYQECLAEDDEDASEGHGPGPNGSTEDDRSTHESDDHEADRDDEDGDGSEEDDPEPSETHESETDEDGPEPSETHPPETTSTG